MMRKFTTCLFIGCSTWFYLSSCNDDEASAPPKTTFTMNKTATLTGGDGNEVTFTVEQVEADAIAILPYGSEESGKGGVLIPKSAFENSVATVKIAYEFVGTFHPVVVTSNFTGDGKSIERTYSDSQTITITSNNASITEFSFDGSTKTTIDDDAKTIVVEMPYANDKGVPYGKDLKAKFAASPFTTVTVAGAAQSSGNTVHNFGSAIQYKVTANDGTSNTYTVTLNQAVIETTTDLKSFNGNSISTTYKNKPIQGYVDNSSTPRYIVMLAPHGNISDVFDSVRVKYETAGKFALVHYATAVDTLKQDSLLNLIITPKSVTVEAQDDTKATYPISTAIAPKLELSFVTLDPDVVGKTELFAITLKVLKTTPLTALSTTAATTPAHAGQAVIKMETVPIDDNDLNNLPAVFTSGLPVNFTTPVKFIVTFTDTNLPGKVIKVEYTATVVGLE